MTLQIVSWNVNGIRAVTKNGFFNWFNVAKPDILFLQEIKAKENQIPKEFEQLSDYHISWNPAERPGYSGTAILSKIKPDYINFNLGIDKFDTEGRVIEAGFGNYVMFGIYFPNGQKDDERLKYKLEFYDVLFNHCKKLRESGKKIIICGDYNTAHQEIDLANPKSNEKRSGFLPIEREWLDKILSFGYFDTFREFNKNKDEYSWWSYRFKAREKNVGWRIDYFFVSDNVMSKVKNSYILKKVTGSDHCPVAIDLDETLIN